MMRVRDYAVLGMFVGGAVLVGCGSDDSSGGGASGASGASGGTGGSLAGSGGSTGTAGTTSTGGTAGTGTGGGSATGGMSGTGGSTGSGDAGGSATDVSTSAECNAYCAKIEGMCTGATCDRAFSCRIRAGDCAASTQAYLKCTVDTGQWACSAGGYSVISTCKRDNTLCM